MSVCVVVVLGELVWVHLGRIPRPGIIIGDYYYITLHYIILYYIILYYIIFI